MQEIIVNGLLTVVVLTAVVLRFFIGTRADSGMTKKQKKMLVRILISAAMLLGLQFLPAEIFAQIDGYLFPSAGRWARFALYLVDYFIIGCDILRKAVKGILNKQVFDENFLMAVATVGPWPWPSMKMAITWKPSLSCCSIRWANGSRATP